MDIDKVEEWIQPERGYAFSTSETFKSEIFSLSTGDRVSVLYTVNGKFELRLRGIVEVNSDEECWQIALKFNKTTEIVNELIKNSFEAGKSEAKRELRTWLRELLMD